jgi:hypothetical protein
MPWCRTGRTPSLDLVNDAKRIVRECSPSFWLLENVRGAAPYLGRPLQRFGPYYFWGDFPPIICPEFDWKRKESYGSKDKAKRAMIPEVLSRAVFKAVTRGKVL